MTRKQFLSAIPFISLIYKVKADPPILQHRPKQVKAIILVKDANVVMDCYNGNCYSVDIYGRDDKDIFYHWKLYYKAILTSKGQSLDPIEVKQFLPPLYKEELTSFSYNIQYEYKTEYLSGPPKALTIEERMIKPPTVKVFVSYIINNENPIKK